jgi:CRP-like cAMP-binding protein
MLEFFNYLNSIHPLSAEATAALMKVIRVKELSKGQVWLQEGAVCDKLAFVVKGLMKMYFESGNKELIIRFAGDNEIMVSAQSYFQGAPSRFAIRAIEPTIILYFAAKEFDHILIKFNELQYHLRILAIREVGQLENHVAILMLSPKARWQAIFQGNDLVELSKKVTDRQLAAYLAVTPNAICTWRKKYNQ